MQQWQFTVSDNVCPILPLVKGSSFSSPNGSVSLNSYFQTCPPLHTHTCTPGTCAISCKLCPFSSRGCLHPADPRCEEPYHLCCLCCFRVSAMSGMRLSSYGFTFIHLCSVHSLSFNAMFSCGHHSSNILQSWKRTKENNKIFQRGRALSIQRVAATFVAF